MSTGTTHDGLEWDDFDGPDDDYDEEEEFWDEALEECGLLPPHLGGGCQMAGTEYCDFECPFRDMDDDEVEPAGEGERGE